MKRAVLQIGIFLISGWLVAATCMLADAGDSLKISQQPLEIAAKKFSARTVTGGMEGTFEGDVKMAQADWTLRCDRLNGLLETRNPGSNKEVNRGKKLLSDLEAESEIKSLTARGHVQFARGDLTATAGQAVYEHAEGTITLTEGPPHFRKGANEGTAKKVIIHLEDGGIDFVEPVFKIAPQQIEKRK